MTVKLRIEVGYGLEGRLPDGKVGRILDDITIPYLQNQEPNSAIIETYKVLANEVLAEYGIEQGQQSSNNQSNSQQKMRDLVFQLGYSSSLLWSFYFLILSFLEVLSRKSF